MVSESSLIFSTRYYVYHASASSVVSIQGSSLLHGQQSSPAMAVWQHTPSPSLHEHVRQKHQDPVQIYMVMNESPKQKGEPIESHPASPKCIVAKPILVKSNAPVPPPGSKKIRAWCHLKLKVRGHVLMIQTIQVV